jgi:enoyl-CoA hydratase
MSKELKTESIGETLIVTFTRPEIRNPLSRVVLDQLHNIVDGLDSRPDIEKLIFTGSGTSFASGANLREIAEVNYATAEAFARHGQGLMTKVQDLSQRTVAAINGFCFGGALDLALACDTRICCREARFAHPGAGLGIITGWGGTQRLPRLIGAGRALEMFLTAEPIDAQTALEWGLVDALSADPVHD